MDTSAIDFPALAVGLGSAAIITAAVVVAARTQSWRRIWLTAAVVTVVLVALALVNLSGEQPRETHIATVLGGIPLPVLGAVGMVATTRRARPWVRWTLVYVTAVLLLFTGALLGAAVLPRYLPG